MTGFIESLVDRFSNAEKVITPRLAGRFEPAFDNLSNQFSESIIEKEAARVSNETDSTASLKFEASGHSDNNKYYKDQLIKDGNINYPPIEKQKTTATNPANNEISSSSQQQENNTNKKPFIQPAGITDGKQAGFGAQPIDQLKENSSFETGDKVMNPVFPDHQLEKEKQRSKVDTSQNFAIVPEQYSAIREESNPELYEYSQSNKTPVIKISIGRIEVLAVPVTNGTKVKDNAPQKPRLTLDEYLQKRNTRQ